MIFDDTIVDTFSNKRNDPIVSEESIRGRELNVSLVFITQSNFLCQKL